MAINFPNTEGQPTDGSFTHTHSGKFWVWNGESWTSSVDRSELIRATFDKLGSEQFTIVQQNLDDGFLNLSDNVDANYYNLSEVQVNGLVNMHIINYTFNSSSQINISNLDLSIGDLVRVFYLKV